MGRAQLDYLQRVLDAVAAADVPGDLAEFGVGRGGGAIFLRAFLEAYEIAGPTVWVGRPFRAPRTGGRRRSRRRRRRALARYRADLNQVRDGFARFDLLDERVRFLHGDSGGRARSDAPIERLALLRFGGASARRSCRCSIGCSPSCRPVAS